LRRALIASLLLVLMAAAPASAQDVAVRFDAAALQPSQSADKFYEADPGLIFGSAVQNPKGGEFPTYRSCGTRVEARGNAPSPPHVARLACGGTPEFPDPPVLFGKFTSTSRTRVSMRVGDAGNGGHVMRLSAFDAKGRLVNRSTPAPIAPNGTTLQVAVGQPEIHYFVLEETGNSVASGVWVDNIVFDTPPVRGQPQFAIARTAGSGTIVLQQGREQQSDITIYRVNGSEGKVDFSVSGVPPGVRTSFSSSVNGTNLNIRAGVNAPVTGQTEPVIVVTGTPQDANTGDVEQEISVPIRVTPAITVSARGVSEPVGLPACQAIQVDYDVAPHAGPARFSMDALPPGVTAGINGVNIASAPPVEGRGTAMLEFRLSEDVTAEVASAVRLNGRTVGDPVELFADRTYTEASPLTLRGLRRLTDLSTGFARTPRELEPGTTVRIRGQDPCARPSARLRFGNDEALAPFRLEGDVMSAEVPRLATSGPVQLVSVDDAGRVLPGRADGPFLEVDNYRNSVGFDFRNYTPNLTVDQMVAAFGREQVYYTPNICGTFTFGLLKCKVGTPIPDPWAMVVLEVANRTMGGSSGGACFGFSTVSQQLRRGTRSYEGLGAPNPRNAFGLGEGPNGGPPGGVNEAINAMQLTQLSEPYLDHYARQAVGNLLAQTPTGLRREIEDFLRRDDHPLLSLRDGGTFDRLHVVVAYDVYTDPADPGAYYIDVYDSNMPFWDEPMEVTFRDGVKGFMNEAASGADHRERHEKSRIRVANDGSWRLPSSGYGGRTLDNIIASGFNNPPSKPKLVTAGGALKNGLTILFGWGASGLINARSADDTGARAAQAKAAPEETPPAEVKQITSGDRRLYKEPGVLNDDPATALRATPWSPATQAGDGEETSEGFLLAAGPGAEYTVEVEGERNAPQTRTVLGENMVAQVKTTAKEGVTDEFTVVPRNDEVGFDPGSASAPLNVQMMVRAGDGSTRTVEADLTTRGSDSVSFDQSESEIVIDHKGPATTVDLTLSSTGRSTLPRAVTAKVQLGRNAKTTLEPASWTKLGKGRLRVRSKGRSRRVALRRKVAGGAKVTSVRVSGSKPRVARAAVRVPASVTRGTATLNFILRRGRRVVAARSFDAGGPGSRTLTWRLPAKARPGDRVVAAATTLVARGSSFNTATSQRQTRVR
jgi:hypothetical protein